MSKLYIKNDIADYHADEQCSHAYEAENKLTAYRSDALIVLYAPAQARIIKLKAVYIFGLVRISQARQFVKRYAQSGAQRGGIDKRHLLCRAARYGAYRIVRNVCNVGELLICEP